MPRSSSYKPNYSSNYRGSRGRRDYRYSSKPRYNRNHYIKAQEVRLIGEDGTNVGVVDIKDAMRMAREQDLDLVEIGPTADPPVCKIISWSKFQYEQKKKEKESKKNKQKDLKEFRFGTFIADGDKERQLTRVREFLDKGHNVKVTVIKKGRRIPISKSKELLNSLLTELSGYSTIEADPSVSGRTVSITLKGEVVKSKGSKPKNAEAEDKKDSSKKVQEDKAQGRKGSEDSVQQKLSGSSKDEEVKKAKK